MITIISHEYAMWLLAMQYFNGRQKAHQTHFHDHDLYFHPVWNGFTLSPLSISLALSLPKLKIKLFAPFCTWKCMNQLWMTLVFLTITYYNVAILNYIIWLAYTHSHTLAHNYARAGLRAIHKSLIRKHFIIVECRWNGKKRFNFVSGIFLIIKEMFN